MEEVGAEDPFKQGPCRRAEVRKILNTTKHLPYVFVPNTAAEHNPNPKPC